MTRLRELAKMVRSKNAGPFELTIDITFSDPEAYRRVRDSGVITRELVSRLYSVDLESVQMFTVDPALSMKVSIPRPVPQGALEDTDIYGGQQYGPLVDIEIP